MNLANLSQEEKDKINVDLATSGVAYKERLNMPIVPSYAIDEPANAAERIVASAITFLF
uniref:DNA polymerase III subunit theta n=1 Tax=Proteus mirabilis TaxID=584 RepID=UPI001E2F26ED